MIVANSRWLASVAVDYRSGSHSFEARMNSGMRIWASNNKATTIAKAWRSAHSSCRNTQPTIHIWTSCMSSWIDGAKLGHTHSYLYVCTWSVNRTIFVFEKISMNAEMGQKGSDRDRRCDRGTACAHAHTYMWALSIHAKGRWFYLYTFGHGRYTAMHGLLIYEVII